MTGVQTCALPILEAQAEGLARLRLSRQELVARARALIADPNSDDGDRNFSPGIVSNRFDWISQLDISKGVYGLDISAAAWYDSVYWENTANKSSATFNPYSVSSGRFTRDVRALHGGDAEIQNAFVYGAATVGGRPLSFRLGRHTLLWGESLFFSDNGIAGAQAPVDYIKVHANPISYARDVYMPVAQASASLQLSNDLALDAYFQFEWRENREEGAGAYLNSEDFVYAGGERFIYEPGRYFYKENFLYPHDKGQFGVALRWTSGEADFGLYALRFNAKSPVVYFRPGIDLDTNAVIDPFLRQRLMSLSRTFPSLARRKPRTSIVQSFSSFLAREAPGRGASSGFDMGILNAFSSLRKEDIPSKVITSIQGSCRRGLARKTPRIQRRASSSPGDGEE